MSRVEATKANNPDEYEETQKRGINVLVFCHAAFADILHKYALAQSDLSIVAFAGLAYSVLMHALVLSHSCALHRIIMAGGIGSHFLSFFVTIVPLLWAVASNIILFIEEGDTLETKRLFEGLFDMITTIIIAMLVMLGWNMWKNCDKKAVGGIERSGRGEALSDNSYMVPAARRRASTLV